MDNSIDECDMSACIGASRSLMVLIIHLRMRSCINLACVCAYVEWMISKQEKLISKQPATLLKQAQRDEKQGNCDMLKQARRNRTPLHEHKPGPPSYPQ